MARRGATRESRGSPREAERLNKLARENPWRLFNVEQICRIFGLGESTLTRLRKLAARDQDSDPWIADRTRPEVFAEWLWHKRKELEKHHRDLCLASCLPFKKMLALMWKCGAVGYAAVDAMDGCVDGKIHWLVLVKLLLANFF
jgi:hypothetical protein